MKKHRRRIVQLCASLFFLLAFFETKPAADTLIALLPECDELHTGYFANGIHEENANYKIAEASRRELSCYEDTKVYMTNSGVCPNEGLTRNACFEEQLTRAVAQNPNLLVQIGLNHSSNLYRRGMQIVYPNENFDWEMEYYGKGAAKQIQTGLSDLGMQTDFCGSLDSEVGFVYPDSLTADYSRTIRFCKQNAVPAVIVNHGFLTNIADVRGFLQDDDKLQKLGVTDAQAIADYYDLHRIYSENDLHVDAEPNSDATVYHISAQGIPRCNSVQIAVWSIYNGQDDLQWYSPKKDENGNWDIDAVMSEYATEGFYAVHVYITKRSGEMYFVGDDNFLHTCRSSVDSMIVTRWNKTQQTCRIQLANPQAFSGIKQITVGVWYENNLAGKRIYPVVIEANTGYADVDLHDFEEKAGLYHMEACIQDMNLITKQVEVSSLFNTALDPEFTVKQDKNKGYFQMILAPIPFDAKQTKVVFEVWNEETSGQAVKTFKANSDGRGCFSNRFLVMNTDYLGTYYVRAVITEAGGTQYDIPVKDILITKENAGDIMKGDVNLDGQINLADAQLTLKLALKIINLSDIAKVSADFNDDGTVNLIDANRVLKKALGII